MQQKPLTADRTPPDFIIRAADIKDLADFLDLALVAGAGFTSLPASECLLAERLHQSTKAFSGESGALILALEDRNASRVVGCAAIKTGSAPRKDFLNFLIDDRQKCLSRTSLYGDLTEVGSLLIHPDYRKFGIGRWLAQSRYLMIAGNLTRFGDHIFSELRGVIDQNNTSPFYDGVLAPYLDLTYEEADHLSAHGRQAELNAMLPTTPIRIDDVGEAAEASIACPHQDGRKALWFLEDEGFRFEGAVDLLDGGPLVVAPSRYIGTIYSSFMASIKPGNVDRDDAETMILAAGEGGDFRSGKGLAVRQGQSVICSPDFLKRMELEPGDIARACPDRKTQKKQLFRADNAELCPP